MPRPPPKPRTPRGDLAAQDGLVAFAVGALAAGLCWLAASRGMGAGPLMGLGDWIAAKGSRFAPHLAHLTDREAMGWGATGIGLLLAAIAWIYLNVTFNARLENREADKIIAANKKAHRLQELVAQRSQTTSPPTGSPSERLRAEQDEFIRRKREES